MYPIPPMPNHHLREWRKARAWTQDELAKLLHTSKFTISRWESGKHRMSRMAREHLKRLGFDATRRN